MATNLFKKGKYEKVMSNDGVVNLESDIPFPKRGIVLLDSKHTIITIDARCRNTDKRSILKCIVKSLLAEEQALKIENGSKAVTESGNKQGNYVRAALGCCRAIVTDNECNPLMNSEVSVKGQTMNEKFSDIIHFDKTLDNGIWKLAVVGERKWDDPLVINALKWFVEAAVQHISYMQIFNAKLDLAASSTETEQEKEAKAAKDKAEKAAAAKAAKDKAEKAAAAKAA